MTGRQKCQCCGSMFDGQSCKYCGFRYIISLDNDAEEIDRNEAKEYRNKIINQIQNITILCYQYGWKEEDKKFNFLDTKRIRLADGNECNDIYKWVSQDFVQGIASFSESSITIEYDFKGNKKQIKCSLSPDAAKQAGQIGLKITKQLRMQLCFGNQNKYVESTAIDLDLH